MNKIFLLIISIILLLISSTNIIAIEYNDVVIKEDLVDFEFCFNPDLEKEFYKENFEPYVDIVSGCEITEQKVIAKLPVKLTTTEYYNETSCLWKDDKTVEKINSTYPQILVCTNNEKSKTSSEIVIEEFDLSKTDILFMKNMSICVQAKRKASNDYQSCDINLNIDMNNDGDFNDISDVKIVNDGFAWWNSTWNFKRKITLDSQSYNHSNGFAKIVLNSSVITYADFNSDGSDIRVTYDNDTLTDYFLENWNTSGNSILWVKAPINSLVDTDIYLYYNSSVLTSLSSINNTFNNGVGMFLSFNSGYADLSSRGQSGTIVNSPEFELDTNPNRVYQNLFLENSQTDYIHYDNPLSDGNQVISLWAKHTDTDSDTEYVFYMYAAGQPQLALGAKNSDDSFSQIGNSGTECNVDVTDTFLDDDWHHIVYVMNDTDNEFLVYIDGSYANKNGCSATNFDSNTALEFPVGIAYSHSGASSFDGNIDEMYFFDGIPDELDGFISNLYNTPSYLIGIQETESVPTDLDFGVFNSTGVNTSLVNEDEEFVLWVNYSYTDNSTNVYPNGYCQFNATNILKIIVNESVGVNTTVCNVGCDSSNLTRSLTCPNTPDGINGDEYVLKLCRDTTNLNQDFTIATSCGYSESFSYNLIPNCAVGFATFVISDENCTGNISFDLSVWSTANNNRDLVVVDTYFSARREHNHTSQNMTWNGTYFVASEHAYEGAGIKEVGFDCFANVSDIENKSDTFSLTVGNVAPVIFIDGISDWITGLVMFSDGISMKYPLESTINVSGGCSDLNLFNAGVNLSYANGTLIYEESFLASGNQVPSSVNFSQGNFSTNLSYLDGSLDYTFCGYCNDTNASLTSSCKSFSAENNIPSGSFDISNNTIISTTPYNFTFSCFDNEGETTNNHVFLDGVLNQSNTNEYFIFDGLTGNHNLTLYCEDSFRNSTPYNIAFSYTESCVINISGLTPNERYRSTNQTVAVNCINGINLSTCYLSVNKYAEEEFNCSGDNIILEVGSNELDFLVVGDGLNTSSYMRVFARNSDSGISAYIVLIILGLAAFICYILFISTSNILYGSFAGVIMIVIGLYVFSFSIVAAIAVWIVSILTLGKAVFG